MLSEEIPGQGLSLGKEVPEQRLNPRHSSRAQVVCVSKQLWFEKIRRPVGWKQKLMRQQSPARSATLPSSGRQREGSSAGPSLANSYPSGS